MYYHINNYLNLCGLLIKFIIKLQTRYNINYLRGY